MYFKQLYLQGLYFYLFDTKYKIFYWQGGGGGPPLLLSGGKGGGGGGGGGASHFYFQGERGYISSIIGGC